MDIESLDWILEDVECGDPSAFYDELEDNDIDYDYKNDGDAYSDSCDSYEVITVFDQNVQAQVNDIVANKEYHEEDDATIRSLLLSDLNEDFDDPLSEKRYIDALEEAKYKIDQIELVWPDVLQKCLLNQENIPDSYVKNTNMEKLILLYADNFIKQFDAKHSHRRQLLLVHENECGYQKCICTTIKPSRLVYSDLDDLDSYSMFVAQHITYKSLDNPVVVPKQMISPAMVLEIQAANCFEMATLLASFLIGRGYNAFVVQGYAEQEVCNNNLTNVLLDFPNEPKDHQKTNMAHLEDVDEEYSVDPPIDLCSEYVTTLIEEERKANNVVQETMEEKEIIVNDPLYGRRVHCWVMILPLKINDRYVSRDTFFIEPSTGERCNISNRKYIGIEAMWNHQNYWVNLQPLDGGCMQYNYTLMNTKCWEHFLMDEPTHLRRLPLKQDNTNDVYTHLFMPSSWVKILEVPRHRYLIKYPAGKKVVMYSNAIKECYADYVMPDGLVKRTTYYEKQDHANKTFVKEVYKHRMDRLVRIDMTYTTEETETVEYFSSGREDCLKTHRFYSNTINVEDKRVISFYDTTRLDSLIEINMDPLLVIARFKGRSDLMFWRLYEFHEAAKESDSSTSGKRKLKVIMEKFLRDESKPSDRDIAVREFNLTNNSILVEHHYGEGQITRPSRMFNKPAVCGDDLKFDEEMINENEVYPYENKMKQYEAYLMLKDMIAAEYEARRDIYRFEGNVLSILETRCRERSDFQLIVGSLDWDRNAKSRRILQGEKDKKQAFKKREKAKQVDYALPYLEAATIPLTLDTAKSIRNKIVSDFRQQTKHQFIKARNVLTKKQFTLESIMNSLENETVLKEVEQKNKMILLCSSIKTQLDMLLLKMERFKEKRIERYNNLALYLNNMTEFKKLPPLKLYARDIGEPTRCR